VSVHVVFSRHSLKLISFSHFLVELVQENDTLTVKGKIVESGREALLLPQVSECQRNGVRFCPECTLKLHLKHTDVLILSQYVRKDGCMMPRRVTGLCKRQQKKIGTLVTMAHKAGLFPNLKPSNNKKAPDQRRNEKKFNTYFFENTIKYPKPLLKISEPAK
jgi:small subunit ribosomal protein S18